MQKKKKKTPTKTKQKIDANMFDSAMDSCIVLMKEFLKITAKAIVERLQLKTFDRV